MKYLQLFENFKWNNPNKRDYYFDSGEWEYKVSVLDNIHNPDYPYIGFRAKKPDEPFYDMSVITYV